MTPRDPVPPDAIGLRVEISPATRDELRVIAATAGKSMAAYVRTLIVADCEQHKARNSVGKKSAKKSG